MPKVETCIALKKAGFPQEVGTWEYVYEKVNDDYRRVLLCNNGREYYKIPSLEELLVWGRIRVREITSISVKWIPPHYLANALEESDTEAVAQAIMTAPNTIECCLWSKTGCLASALGESDSEAVANTILSALGRVK